MQQNPGPHDTDDEHYPDVRYAWYVVAVLTLAYVVSFIDRQILGIFVGSGLAYILGGMVVGFSAAQENFVLPLVGTVRSWQLVFLVVGLPGLVVALLLFTIREPARKGVRRMTADSSPQAAATMG